MGTGIRYLDRVPTEVGQQEGFQQQPTVRMRIRTHSMLTHGRGRGNVGADLSHAANDRMKNTSASDVAPRGQQGW